MNEIRTSRLQDRPGATVQGMRRGLALLGALALATLLSVGAVDAPAAKPKPPIAGVTLEGKRLALAELRDKPVLINVWSSW